MNQTDPPTYRTLFLFTLRQTTAMSVGGTDESSSISDMPITRDGGGRLVLRGSALAGHLLATARTFLDVPEAIARDLAAATAKQGDDADVAGPPSLWDCWNAHPWDTTHRRAIARKDEPKTQLRASAPHRHDTRTSANLFDLEVIERGGAWRGLLEVHHDRNDEAPGAQAALIAALALREWQRGRCWLGRRVARGLGWMQLEDCAVHTLPAIEELVDAWPNSALAEREAVDRYIAELVHKGAREQTLAEYLAPHAGRAALTKPRRAYVRWPLRITVGPYQPSDDEDTCWGLDALSIGGHGAVLPAAADFGERHFARAVEQSWQKFEQAFDPDFALATERIDGEARPLVPGSAVAGALRAHLSRLHRAAGTPVLDPATGERYAARDPATGSKRLESTSLQPPDPVAAVFGQLAPRTQPDATRSSALLFGDASLSGDDWLIALLEKVALDEFAQSAYSGAKFDRMAVLCGSWSLSIVQEVDLGTPPQDWTGSEADWLAHVGTHTGLMRKALAATALRRIGLGGGEFRAYGHVAIEIEGGGAQWATAGSDWRALEPGQPAAD